MKEKDFDWEQALRDLVESGEMTKEQVQAAIEKSVYELMVKVKNGR